MDEILRQLDYIPERIYGLWSTAIVMTVIASLLLYYLYKVYKKFDTDKTFSKCLLDFDFPIGVQLPIIIAFMLITFVTDSFIIIGFLSGVVRLILF